MGGLAVSRIGALLHRCNRFVVGRASKDVLLSCRWATRIGRFAYIIWTVNSAQRSAAIFQQDEGKGTPQSGAYGTFHWMRYWWKSVSSRPSGEQADRVFLDVQMVLAVPTG